MNPKSYCKREVVRCESGEHVCWCNGGLDDGDRSQEGRVLCRLRRQGGRAFQPIWLPEVSPLELLAPKIAWFSASECVVTYNNGSLSFTPVAVTQFPPQFITHLFLLVSRRILNSLPCDFFLANPPKWDSYWAFCTGSALPLGKAFENQRPCLSLRQGDFQYLYWNYYTTYFHVMAGGHRTVALLHSDK